MTPAASHAVTGSSPALLESKLVPPHLTLNLLARTQLSTLLQLGLAKRMVTVAAPAGYGKSTALSQFSAWADKQALVTAWLSLDAEDNDPLRFVHYLAGALNHADRDLGRGALAQIGAGNISSIEAIVASLVHDLATCGRRVVLVLDDFHVIENDLVHRKLEWLIAHTPPTVLFVLAGRTRLPLAVSQLRMRDELLELDTSHLCLRLEEAAEFVSRISGAALDRRHVETLHGLTEGWIAALQLASLALRQSDDKAAFLAAFSGTDRDITDYLGEQVLDSLPAEIRAFLLSTALLDRFCADLCDDVLSRADSRAMLAEVQARNLFLIGLDRTRTWFRYHHLFADYLRTRGREERPAQARAIYRRASAWFDQHGLRHEAVRYAFEGGDLERAADLVGAFSAELVQHRGEHATLLSWLARLPADLVHARPKIRIGHAWSLVLTRRYAEADRELKELERGSVSEHDDDVRCVVEMIRCVYFALTDQAVLAKEKADAWLESWPRAEVFLTGVVANVFAFGCCETDDFERGVQALALARRSFAQRNAHYGTAWSSALSMLISIRRGDYAKALAEAGEGIGAVERSLGVASYAGSMLMLLAAEVCYERNELEQARVFLEHGMPFVDEHGTVEMTTAGYLTGARLARLRGEHARAEACLLEGESLGYRLELPRVTRVLAAERCLLRLQCGPLDDAIRLAQSYGFLGRGEPGSVPPADAEEEAVRFLAIRLRVRSGDASRAMAALNDEIRRAQQVGHHAHLARLLAFKAVQQHRALDRAQALRTLDEALALGARCGLLRTFLDEDPLVIDLVQEIFERRHQVAARAEALVRREYLAHLLSAAGRTVQAPPARLAEEPATESEALTERELKILRLMQAGLRNRELAQSLFISEATVKWHLHNIFAKLGVKNRTGALARAREISLL